MLHVDPAAQRRLRSLSLALLILAFGSVFLLPHAWTRTFLLLAAQGQANNSQEMSTQETQPTFTVRAERNLVIVRVVVRDSKGQVITNLHKEDFRLLDNGKPQTISQFALEGPGAPTQTAPRPLASEAVSNATAPEGASATPAALRFLGLFYDDVHTPFEDLARTRDAAEHYLGSALTPGDRVGVFTSSGQVVQDFTDNRDKLHEALGRLRPRPVVPRETDPCPDISPYQAHLMVNQNDSFAIDAGAQSVIECQCGGDAGHCPNPQQVAMGEAQRILTQDETQSEYSLRGLEALIRRLSVAPGQRGIVLISRGFLAWNLQFPLEQVVDRALHAGVVINALDSQGLAVLIPGGDASHHGSLLNGQMDLVAYKTQMATTEFSANSDPLAQFAAETGGFFFHNSNDYDGGFKRVAGAASVYYALGFSPQILKFDGKFHTLKVDVVSAKGFGIQARRGYFAPRQSPDAKERVEDDIKEAIFSQDDLQELPIDVRTQFFKVNQLQAQLSVLAHLDVRALHFRKAEERNLDDLRFISIVFDRDGNYVDGTEKLVALKLTDTTLTKLLRSGITVKTNFKVKPGSYMVREVIRDSEGGHISGLSRAVEIPY